MATGDNTCHTMGTRFPDTGEAAEGASPAQDSHIPRSQGDVTRTPSPCPQAGRAPGAAAAAPRAQHSPDLPGIINSSSPARPVASIPSSRNSRKPRSLSHTLNPLSVPRSPIPCPYPHPLSLPPLPPAERSRLRAALPGRAALMAASRTTGPGAHRGRRNGRGLGGGGAGTGPRAERAGGGRAGPGRARGE